MRTPRLAVIIPTLNEGGTIARLISSLNADGYANKEIIVVDGGSSDGTADIARKLGARVLTENGAHKCPANARNQGARSTRAGVLCFLDGDTDNVKRGFSAAAMRHFSDPSVAGVQSKLENPKDSFVEDLFDCNATLNYKLKAVASKKLRWGASPPFIRRELFIEAGGYKTIGIGEDILLSKKIESIISKRKMRIVQEPKSVLRFHTIHSLRELFKQQRWYGRTMPVYLREADAGAAGYLYLAAPVLYMFGFLSPLLYLVNPLLLVLSVPYALRVGLLLVLAVAKLDKRYIFLPALDIVQAAGLLKGFSEYVFGFRKLSRC